MSFQVAVRLAAHFALGFLRTAGRAAAVVYLCVSGITVGALLPVLLAIVLIRAVFEIVSFQAAVFLAAHATLSLFRTAGRAAAVGRLCINGIAAGALQPVIVLVVPPYRKIVAAGGDFFCLFSAANRAGISLFAIRCAGRWGGHFAFVPGVGGFVALRLAAAIHFPVFIGISLPIAQLAGVIIGVLLAGLEGFRACSIADAGLVVHRLVRAGRIGHQIITTRILLIVDAGGYILLIAAGGTLMEVACIISLPRGGIAVLGFSALLPAFALVPVLAIICLPVAGIAVGGCVLRCVAVFALVIVVGFVTAPLRCVVDMVAHRKDFTI